MTAGTWPDAPGQSHASRFAASRSRCRGRHRACSDAGSAGMPKACSRSHRCRAAGIDLALRAMSCDWPWRLAGSLHQLGRRPETDRERSGSGLRRGAVASLVLRLDRYINWADVLKLTENDPEAACQPPRNACIPPCSTWGARPATTAPAVTPNRGKKPKSAWPPAQWLVPSDLLILFQTLYLPTGFFIGRRFTSFSVAAS